MNKKFFGKNMNPITLTTLKFKRTFTKRRLINLGWALLLVAVIGGGYFLGKKIPQLNLAAIISRTPVAKEVGQVPQKSEEMEKIEIVLPTAKTYEEIAEEGEGITHLARKALKRYLTEKGEGLNLTPEHKIFIEDYLQKKTGDFWLKVGQKLTFSEELIKEGIEKAQQLTPEQLQNLTQYSQLVPELNY